MLKPKPVDDESPDLTQPLITREVVGVVLVTATALTFAVVAALASVEAAQRSVERSLSVLVVGTLVTAALLLPRQAWTDSRVGRTFWRVGCGGVWLWAVVAGLDIAMWLRDRPTDAQPFLQSAEDRLRSAHAVVLGLMIILAVASARPTRTLGQRLAAAGALAAVLTLPLKQLEHLPWSVRLNDAVHGTGAAVWVGTVAAVVVVGFVRIDTFDPRQRWRRRGRDASESGPRPYRAYGKRPADPAYGHLTYASNELSALALACASVVIVTGSAMALGVAQASTDFFAGPWGGMLILKIILGTALVAFGTVHRIYGLKLLNGEELGPRSRWVIGLLPSRFTRKALGPGRFNGSLFVWVAAVEVVVLLATLFVGVSMNVAGAPL